MQPVITTAEMQAIDAAAPESVEVLIQRAGWAVARHALAMLGGSYGARVTVLHGPGNNGADGLAAAAILRRRGVRVAAVGLTRDGWVGRPDPDSELIIDAGFGTGFSGDLIGPPVPAAVPVLAVDVPSGLHGDSGNACPATLRADRTVTFAAAKPGHYLNDGPRLCGELVVSDIGLDCSRAAIHRMESSDLARWPRRRRDAHKWDAAVWVVGGSPGMTGSIALAATAAFRAGAGYVTLSIPGGGGGPTTPVEAVSVPVGEAGKSARHGALVVGPGLRDPAVAGAVLNSGRAAVVDAGALADFVPRAGATILTPHDGEFTRLFGHSGDPDRIDAVRAGARVTGAVVLLKGPTTVIADPGGAVRLVTDGDARLATAGTGDVLSGVIGAGLALGLDPFEAASLGAQLHATAAMSTHDLRSGLMASDLPDLIAATLDA